MSSTRISRFAGSADPWIVAVRMVSEGVDIPRLRVGVWATTTTTDLFFRQAVGRFVRWTRGVPRQKAYLFIPDDVRLRTWASQIADARRHSLRKPSEDDEADGTTVPADEAQLDEQRHEDDDARQLSMFAPLSAVVTGDAEESSVFHLDDDVLDRLDRADASDAVTDDAVLDLALPVLPAGPGGDRHVAAGSAEAVNPREHRAELRAQNQRLVQEIARATGWTHPQVNRELNRLAGVERIGEATVVQLARRARHAERWLAKESRRVGTRGSG
jgi:hypothetical protein